MNIILGVFIISCVNAEYKLYETVSVCMHISETRELFSTKYYTGGPILKVVT